MSKTRTTVLGRVKSSSLVMSTISKRLAAFVDSLLPGSQQQCMNHVVLAANAARRDGAWSAGFGLVPGGGPDEPAEGVSWRPFAIDDARQAGVREEALQVAEKKLAEVTKPRWWEKAPRAPDRLGALGSPPLFAAAAAERLVDKA